MMTWQMKILYLKEVNGDKKGKRQGRKLLGIEPDQKGNGGWEKWGTASGMMMMDFTKLNLWGIRPLR